MARDKPIYYDYKIRLPWYQDIPPVVYVPFQVILLLILLFYAIPFIFALIPMDIRGPHEAKINATKVSLNNIGQALAAFNVDCGRFPTTEEGLDALVTAPTPIPPGWHDYMDKVPKDGWGNPFVYVSPGPDRADFDLYSMGLDGKRGTDDDVHLRDLK